ncbi:hypothetical protein CapIbe_008331 [Capra ibex]
MFSRPVISPTSGLSLEAEPLEALDKNGSGMALDTLNVEASKGLERYYRNGGDSGVPETEWGISNIAAMLPSCRSESS